MHSINATVESMTDATVELRKDGQISVTSVPREVIVSAEISCNEGTWSPCTLAPPTREALDPITTTLLTGSGALLRTLTRDQLSETAAVFERVQNALYNSSLRDQMQHLKTALADIAGHNPDEFDSVRIAVGRANDAIILIGGSGVANPTIFEAGQRLKSLTESLWGAALSRFNPKLRVINEVGAIRLTLEQSGEFSLPIRITANEGRAPASGISIQFDENESLSFLSLPALIEELAPGETKTLRARVVAQPDFAQAGGELTVRVQLHFKTPLGEKHFSPKQTLRISLSPAVQYERLRSPFSAYAGGTTVADPEMFFGRSGLLDELAEELGDGPLGRGYALYGQKRSGKSSLVEQLRLRLSRQPNIVVPLSFGILDRKNLTVSFVRALLDRIRLTVIDVADTIDLDHLTRLWPTEEKIEKRPLECLQQALVATRKTLTQNAGWAKCRFIFLFDEFTYLYEVLRNPDYSDSAREDIREFMRQWKALLESRVFCSVIVGQDTLPEFMRRFPNEFSSMTPIRIGYLSLEETKTLADHPILLPDGSSRYRGYALESIFEYTAGHPYFTQVVCDRLVAHMNQRRGSEISDVDVSDTVDRLTRGQERIEPILFDCLLSADNTGLVTMRSGDGTIDEIHDPDRDMVFTVLSRIALACGPGERSADSREIVLDDYDASVLQDLVMREVVEEAAGLLRIKIPLFSEYLRAIS